MIVNLNNEAAVTSAHQPPQTRAPLDDDRMGSFVRLDDVTLGDSVFEELIKRAAATAPCVGLAGHRKRP